MAGLLLRQVNDMNGQIINRFPGYECRRTEKGVENWYRGVELGTGGYVYANPGMYTNVALLDVSSMHPTSIILLNKLGEYTKNFENLKLARILIKHEDYEDAGKLFDGKLSKYLTSKESAEALAKALKYPINALFGVGYAKYQNPARDSRDINNIVALRGALFMKTLQDEVTARGFTVAHIKTDSIKVPDATPEIIQFIFDFGKKYGYDFEHECTYEKMCLVNNAVYIAKYDSMGIRNKHGKHAGEWTATGAQFQQPFVFKSLFSKEPIEHVDVCETKEVSKGGGLYLDMNEGLPEDEHAYQFIGRVGDFCPIKAGCGGGVLVREKDGKYNAVTGTKKEHYNKEAGEEPVYRWLESEVVEKLDKWSDVDFSYYTQLVDAAVSDISKYGDFEWFTSDDPVPPVKSKLLVEPDSLKEITASADSDSLKEITIKDDSDPLKDFMNIPEDAPEEIPFLPE